MKKILTLMLIAISFLLSSCAGTAVPVSPTLDPALESEVSTAASHMAEGLVTSLVESDYPGFNQNMDQVMSNAMTEDAFTQIQALLENRLGTYQSMHLDDLSLDQGYYIANFTLHGDLGDTTMRLVLQTTSPYLITGLWFPD